MCKKLGTKIVRTNSNNYYSIWSPMGLYGESILNSSLLTRLGEDSQRLNQHDRALSKPVNIFLEETPLWIKTLKHVYTLEKRLESVYYTSLVWDTLSPREYGTIFFVL